MVTKRKLNVMVVILLATLTLLGSCKDDDTDPIENKKNLTLNISGLEDLGSEAIYEGWVIVDGNPVSTGTFSVNDQGAMSRTVFALNEDDLDNASAFVLTIEPVPDSDPTPSQVHLLGGDFNGMNASLSIDHAAALNNDFSSSAGIYILATPTDTSTSDEESGIWFLDISSGSPVVGLNLPTLPNGWKYEGWVVIDGQPVSTGTFSSVDMADDAAPFSGMMSGPPFPGEDFLMNAPTGLTFPTDIRGGTAVISIEPSPDNSTNPFLLKPLVGSIDQMADVHSNLPMDQNLQFPAGTASK